MIWGDISRYINGENVLGGVAYKNKEIYYDDKCEYAIISCKVDPRLSGPRLSTPRLSGMGN